MQSCFKGPRKAIRLQLKHARTVRRAKYGANLLNIFVKRPNVALKSLLRTAVGTTTTDTLPTDLSIIKNEAKGVLITNP